MEDLLFFVKTDNDKHFFYEYEKALNYFKNNGGKLYGYTKDLFPKKILLFW